MLCLWVLAALTAGACTFIGFNRAPVSTRVDDSHDASGTNGVHSFDINVSPR